MTYRVRFAPVFSSVCALLCATSAPEFARAAQIPSRDAALGAYFDADASSTEIEVELIRLARTRVLVAGGASVPAAVASALCAARGRGVDVRVVLGTASFAQTRDARGAGNFNVFYRAPQLAQSYATEFWRLYGLARR
ncbi:hypothetical protein [Burkholderia sp. ABCPW 111]|uniref:hypothetical protein n=1 Tax=Burkholderia sp. ABCPW 111 TaxID=1820025 RepID=UPI000530EEC0|nr:hypothetical protein [Burkholderia sp. ABCPW 111]KGS05981.1 hypothetical protein X946_2378 [Burkholderia sp. ABCPW 111]